MSKKAFWFIVLATGNSILFLLSILKINVISGSVFSYFSFGNIIGPLFGFYLGLPAALALFGLRIIFKSLFLGTSLISPLSWYIPTMFASAYWTNSSIIRLWVPLICITLFTLHPIGHQAFYYSLYWLIPIVLYFIKEKSMFLHALASTFIAHAVGSVLWLYWLPMQPETFAALMPIVAVERLIMASGMVAVHYMLTLSKNYFIYIFSENKPVILANQ